MKFLGKGLAVGVVAGWACVAGAFPSWMGVYGDYTTHNGSNPGVYTILMNQDYWGLHAEVGIGISNQWTTHAMTYMGNVSGNSLWQYYPATALASNTTVYYYFHGWDDWGGNIYANNYGNNYSFVAGPAELEWIGATTHTPASPVAGQDIRVWTQTWPKGAGQSGLVLYETDAQWLGVGLNKVATTNQNDLWAGLLGRFPPGAVLTYLVGVEDGAQTTHYDNNGGAGYAINVSTGAPLTYLGGAYHWPTNGALADGSYLVESVCRAIANTGEGLCRIQREWLGLGACRCRSGKWTARMNGGTSSWGKCRRPARFGILRRARWHGAARPSALWTARPGYGFRGGQIAMRTVCRMIGRCSVRGCPTQPPMPIPTAMDCSACRWIIGWNMSWERTRPCPMPVMKSRSCGNPPSPCKAARS